MRKEVLLAALLSLVLLVGGCKDGCVQTIAEATCDVPGDISEQPDDYLGEEICVAGVVSQIVDIPMTDHDYYKVVGDKGGVWVQGGSPPPKGTKVTARGKLLRGKECGSPLVEYVVCEASRSVD